jgi:hypothetical protein
MITRVRLFTGIFLLCSLFPIAASAQCAPAPDSAYFFRNLSEQRAEARIARNRPFYDTLLSANFTAPRTEAAPLDKNAFIDRELGAREDTNRRQFFSIRDYKLVEHRKGFAVVSYLLIEGSTGDGETRAVESWHRESYEVQNGQWRLRTVEVSPITNDGTLTRAAREIAPDTRRL